MNSYKVKYHMDGKQRTKVVKAATPRGALIKFKRAFGIKGITAERAYTKAEREAISKAAKPTGRKACFDGRTMCFLMAHLLMVLASHIDVIPFSQKSPL